MIDTNYRFGTISTVVAPGGVTPISPDAPSTPAVLLELGTNASRQEGDLTLGYLPLDWFGVAIGYKGIFQRFDREFRDPVNGVTASDSTKLNYNGITFGVLVNAQIDDRFSLIGNAFGGYLFVGCGTACSSGNSPYTAAKLVLRYAPTPQFSVTLGYRVQIVNNPSKTPSTSNLPGLPVEFDAPSGIDVTHGAIMGVSYRF
jgi:hypothetical protein